jgi:hypothetical protein
VAAASPLPVSTPEAATLAPLLERAAGYVHRFAQEFAAMIADERFDQFVRVNAPPTVQARPIDRRRIVSEVLFMWLPGDRSWLTARNVREVDGAAVADSAVRMGRLLAPSHTDTVAQARLLRDEGVRFNTARSSATSAIRRWPCSS